MVLPIPIPIGARHVACVRGTVWKLVSCEQCNQPYAYLVELEATGEIHDLLFWDGAGAAERAREQAEQNLTQKSRNTVVPVPCPNCGFYQENMARRLKDNASINGLQIAGGAIFLMSLVPLAFGNALAWGAAMIGALTGLSLLTYGYVIAFRFDPNAGDPAPRKSIGQRCAVWGEQLADIAKASQSPQCPTTDDRA